MDERTRPPLTRPSRGTARSGLGVACYEAQADGVPCSDVGAQCGECDRAQTRRQGQDQPAPPASPAQPANDDA
jgi:hypothetical protein